MNKELNIFTLRMLRDQYEAEHLDTEVEALDAAIEALEQPDLQPTCNQLATDCISREVVLNWLENEWDGIVVHVFDGIKNLPSAQPGMEQIRWERDVAIQQLKDLGYGLGEKPRTDGDLISRQAAIEAIEQMQIPIMRSDDQYEMFKFSGMSEALNAIKELPSAQPERKKGKWIIHKGACEPDYMECSRCKWITEYYGGLEETWDFCPHCGCEMRQEGEDHGTTL